MDYLVVGPSADLIYLSGMQSRPSERMTVFILSQEGPAHVVIPAFEAPLLPDLPPDTHVHTWGESDNPARLAANIVSREGHIHPGGFHCTIGVGERLWATFLLALQAELPRASFISAASVMTPLRMVKDQEEIEWLERSGAAADLVFARIVQQPFAGRTEKEVAQELAHLLEAQGLSLEHLPIVASGPNSASPHHHAGDRRIAEGDAVVLDFGGTLNGYFSDITRTVFVGSAPAPDSEEVGVYNLVAQAQLAAAQAARLGMACEALDAAARDIIAGAGYGEYFNHRLGHGIGLDGHEPPYLVSGNDTLLQPGMTFSIEPGVYLPGKFGVRIEDIVVLEDSGARSFNHAPKEITVVS
jgi:D-alanyl-D-alanine dipeptidase